MSDIECPELDYFQVSPQVMDRTSDLSRVLSLYEVCVKLSHHWTLTSPPIADRWAHPKGALCESE